MSIYEDISAIAGEKNTSNNPLDLICYSHDLAPIPDGLIKAYGALSPDLVVRPDNISRVSEIMKYAHHNNVPVTPRSGGSWGMGGVLPMDGGIVLDLNGMNHIKEIIEADEYVTVETGMEWKRLSDMLDKRGFQVGAYPTSAPVATIGGYLSTGGSSGIGIPLYGPAGNQVISLGIVMPDGGIIYTDPWDSWLFMGAEGTLGIICEITLKIYKKTRLKHFLFGFEDINSGLHALEELSKLKPYFYTFMDREFIKLLNKKGSDLPVNEMMVSITIQNIDSSSEIDEETLNRICDGTKYSDETAEKEWDNRFKAALSIKSIGPTLLAQEIRLPARSLGQALGDWKRLLINQRFAFKGACSDFGAVNILPVILTDERRKTHFIKSLSYTNDIARIGMKYNGATYGVGLYNSYQMPAIHAESLDVMQEIKRKLDPKGILNPAKTVQMRVPPFIINFMFKIMKYFPYLAYAFIKICDYIPIRSVRTTLRFIGDSNIAFQSK